MATTKNITMKQFNGNDYDTLYPQTQGSQIIGSVPIVSGGTGGINATSGMYNLLNGMSTIAPATNDLFPFKDVSGSTSGLVTLTNLITAMGNNGVITTSNLNTQASNLGFSKIQTGSYVGTGTYGASNPCSLTFDFIPKLLIFYNITGDVLESRIQILVLLTSSYSLGGVLPKSVLVPVTYYNGTKNENFNTYSKIVNTTIYWYVDFSMPYQGKSAEPAPAQLNQSGTTYRYFVIG